MMRSLGRVVTYAFLSAGLVSGCTIGATPAAICGDLACDSDENAAVCPSDCEAACGNDACEPGEIGFCIEDCPSDCGNGTCDPGEDMLSCAWDCFGGCGDGTCGVGETEATCPADCMSMVMCGDGVCDPGEAGSCAADCTISFCGDGVCDATEDWSLCPADCPTGAVCGDHVCDASESSATCPADCGGGGFCGDGFCDWSIGEDSWSCPTDCGGGGFCGDGFCDWSIGEDSWSCPIDCGGGGFCGDGWCDVSLGEDSWGCPSDCWCGDGLCDWSEDSFSCPWDCGGGGWCGDGICDAFIGEDAFTCAPDCGGTTGAAIGSACTTDSDCASSGGLTPVCFDEASTGYPGGYCGQLGCDPSLNNCPVGTLCDSFSDGMGGTIGVCMAGCNPSATGLGGCRADVAGDSAYACRPDLIDPFLGSCHQGCETDQGCNTCDTVSGMCENDPDFPCLVDADCMLAPVVWACETTVNLCYPNHAAGTADIGDPCTDDAECPGNAFCAGADGTSTMYAGGYCTSLYCDSLGALPEFQCAGAGVCPSSSGFLGGYVQMCTAPCSIDVSDPDGECDLNRGDNLDYICIETSNIAVDPSELFDTPGAAGFCFQCDELLGPGFCPVP